MIEAIDAQHSLAATRFTIWVSFLLAAFVMAAYLHQSCQLRFWNGEPFNRALAGWTLEAFFLSMHQAYWWAVEHLSYVGHCKAHDPLIYDAVTCADVALLRSYAPYVTPFFYVGIIMGLVLIVPPLVTSVTGFKSLWVRAAVKASIVVIWGLGWFLSSA